MMSKKIQVVELKPGAETIDWAQNGNRITLRDELTLDLSRYERDYEVKLDVCDNRDGILVIGLSDYYVAQLLIAARQYEEETVEVESFDGDGEMREEVVRKPLPFDISCCTLTLWPLDGTGLEGMISND